MIRRTFGVPDPDMFESGRTMRALFISHKAAFVAKDVNVDDPFAAEWLESIEASEAVETDEVREDQQQQETADVDEQMELGRKKYTEVKYYVEVAFANKPAIKNKFGLDNYDEAANNQARMATFLKNLHKQCQHADYKPALLTAGLTQLQIDEIATIHNALLTENTDQNEFIQNSPEATEARIVQYNSTYAFAQKINRLSKVVYYGNTTMLNTFKLPEANPTDPDINVKGKVTDSATGNPLKGVRVKIVELELTDTTSFYGNYHFVSIPAGTYTLRYLLDGYGQVDHPITVLADGVVTDNAVLTVV